MLLRPAVDRFNACFASFQSSPRWQRRFTIITYTGRRSGRTFVTPVAYKRAGNTVTIGVQAPGAKNWWRNFLDGGPIMLQLDGVHRTGHAVSRRDDRGRVTVTVRLDD
jgi:F420H(2)-dependent quinone reductase